MPRTSPRYERRRVGHRRCHSHRPRPASPRAQGRRARRRSSRDARAPDRAPGGARCAHRARPEGGPDRMSVGEVLALMSWRPARIAGLAVDQGGDQGGPIGPGRRQHLRRSTQRTWEVDPARLASRSRNTPWAGGTVTGKVRHTIFRGEPVVVDARGTAMSRPERGSARTSGRRRHSSSWPTARSSKAKPSVRPRRTAWPRASSSSTR